jgi:hypothetical protein
MIFIIAELIFKRRPIKFACQNRRSRILTLRPRRFISAIRRQQTSGSGFTGQQVRKNSPARPFYLHGGLIRPQAGRHTSRICRVGRGFSPT